MNSEEKKATEAASELNERLGVALRERDIAISMLADWCVAVENNGAGWDDWDEFYKDAAYRPCELRGLLDAAIAKAKEQWDA